MRAYIKSKKLNHPLIKLGLKKAELQAGLKKLGHWEEKAKEKKTRKRLSKGQKDFLGGIDDKPKKKAEPKKKDSVTYKGKKYEVAPAPKKAEPKKAEPKKKIDPNSTGQKNLQALLNLGDLSEQISKEAEKRRIITSIPLDDPRILDDTHLQVRKKPLTVGEYVKWRFMSRYNQSYQDPITKDLRDMAKKEYAEYTKDKKKLVFIFPIDINDPDNVKDGKALITGDRPKVLQVDSKGKPTAINTGANSDLFSPIPVNFHSAQKAFFKQGDLGKVARNRLSYLSGVKDSKV
jgi:hypothetical protein